MITFFNKKKEYRCLSNFWEGKVSIDNIDYLSGELCFHGEKYRRLGLNSKDDNRKKILLDYSKRFCVDGDIKTSEEAKKKGGKGKNGLKLEIEELKLWNILSVEVQFEICRYKLENYEEVKEHLKKSGISILIHPALRCSDEKMKDKIWEGRMVEKNGEMVILGGNKLGNIWMKLRNS